MRGADTGGAARCAALSAGLAQGLGAEVADHAFVVEADEAWRASGGACRGAVGAGVLDAAPLRTVEGVDAGQTDACPRAAAAMRGQAGVVAHRIIATSGHAGPRTDARGGGAVDAVQRLRAIGLTVGRAVGEAIFGAQTGAEGHGQAAPISEAHGAAAGEPIRAVVLAGAAADGVWIAGRPVQTHQIGAAAAGAAAHAAITQRARGVRLAQLGAILGPASARAAVDTPAIEVGAGGEALHVDAQQIGPRAGRERAALNRGIGWRADGGWAAQIGGVAVSISGAWSRTAVLVGVNVGDAAQGSGAAGVDATRRTFTDGCRADHTASETVCHDAGQAVRTGLAIARRHAPTAAQRWIE